MQKVKGKDEKVYLINASLNTLLGKVMKIFNDLDMNDEVVSVNKTINRLKGKDESQMTLFKAYEFLIAFYFNPIYQNINYETQLSKIWEGKILFVQIKLRINFDRAIDATLRIL
jgi:hypothetical protein